MQELLKRVSAWMASHSSTYVIAAAVMAFLLPDTFCWVRGDVSSVILGVIMLTMGLTLTADDFRSHPRSRCSRRRHSSIRRNVLPLLHDDDHNLRR